jgi:hypothetical protein
MLEMLGFARGREGKLRSVLFGKRVVWEDRILHNICCCALILFVAFRRHSKYV